MGSSTKVAFLSALAKSRGGSDYLEFGRQEYQEMLSWFLKNKDNLKRRISPSSYISFSASLVTTLRRAEWLRNQDYKEIQIAALDTHQLGRDHVVLPMVALSKAFNTSECRQFIDKDSVDEFLGWYRLDVDTPVVEHSILVHKGVHKLVPEIPHCAERVGGDLAYLRVRLFGRSAALITKHFELAMALGDALYPRNPDAQIVVLCLRSHERHGDTLSNSMRVELESAIRVRCFEPNGRVSFRNARYWNWLENKPSGTNDAESKLALQSDP